MSGDEGSDGAERAGRGPDEVRNDPVAVRVVRLGEG